MNLAFRDIRFNLPRFLLTVCGLSLLIMIVMGMMGIYRGLVDDATLLVNSIEADLWIVQRDTRGPFAEVSRVPATLEERALSVPGVESAHAFVSHTIQREHQGRPLRMTLQGLSWPEDRGEWLPITVGRPLTTGRYELIADESLGLSMGERIELGKDTYEVVGLTRHMVSSSGDGFAFLSVRDALAIQFDTPAEAIRLEREARAARAEQFDLSRTMPTLVRNADLPASSLPAIAPPQISAVLITLKPATDPEVVRAAIAGWSDVSALTSDDQRDLLLRGAVDKARRQLRLFTFILIIVSAVTMSLILYTLTLDKVHSIAMLKLMGARNPMILGLILQQALLMGLLAYGLAYYLGIWIFPRFPRRVLLSGEDLLLLAGIILVVSFAASLLGIAKAMRVQPNEVLS